MTTAILGLWAETSIHAGAGSSVGVIDLPIQREAHTGWPCVFGSSAKGALRTAADDWLLAEQELEGVGDIERNEMADAIEDAARSNDVSWLVDVFGPPTSRADAHAGALAVGDARLLLLPVRSLTSHFKWATCPALLRRALRDWRRLGFAVVPELEAEVQAVADQINTLSAENPAFVVDAPTKLFLEELRFTRHKHPLSQISRFLGDLLGGADATEMVKQQLAIIGDDLFVHLTRFATPVTPHIAIDNSRKRVVDGALWYEETLPPETVMYVPLLANRSRRSGSQKTAQDVLEHLTLDLFGEHPYLQIGGNETVGMGWFHVTPLSPPARVATDSVQEPISTPSANPAPSPASPVDRASTSVEAPSAPQGADASPANSDGRAVAAQVFDQTIQQQRAAYAAQQVRSYFEGFTQQAQTASNAEPQVGRDAAATNRKKFKARASELPFLIHNNGLGQALTFFASKAAKQNDKDRYGCLYTILSEWLTQPGQPFEGKGDALTGLTQCNQTTYREAQSEAILLMEWVKLLASATAEETSPSTNTAPVNTVQVEQSA